MEKVVVSAPGKVIIAGEHAVVYGKPALAAAVNKRLKVIVKRRRDEKVVIKDKCKDLSLARWLVDECLKYVEYKGIEVEIESEIPVGSGLGSSAALATGIVWAMLTDKDDKVKNLVVERAENYQHGKASGVDQTIVREGGVLRFEKGKIFKVRNLKYWQERTFMLIDSGKPMESTGEMVKMVAKGLMNNDLRFKRIFKRMGEIVDNWKPELIKENQRLLEKIGVVGEKAKKMVREIEVVGGSAKVCGAGGVKKGSGMLLVWANKNDWKSHMVNLGVEGVRYEG